MRFIKAKKGEDAGALARRAHGASPRADLRDAEREIVEVNPALHQRRLEGDELVLVPSAGQGAGRGGHGGKEVASALLDQARERIDAFRGVLDGRFEKRGAAAREDLQRLKGKDAARLARRNPALKNRVPAAVTRATRTVQRVDEMRTRHQEALEQVSRDLDGLLATFREVSPADALLKSRPTALPRAEAPRPGPAPGPQKKTASTPARAEVASAEKKPGPAPRARKPDAPTEPQKSSGPRKR